MSTEPISGDENDAEVIPLPVAAGTLENAPAPPAPAAEGNRRPIIPQSLRPANLRGTVGQTAGLYGYRAAYHGVRLPLHLAVIAWCAVRGAGRLTGRLLAWWHWLDGHLLESQAVARGGRDGHADAMRVHVEGKKTRKSRGQAVAAIAAVVLVAGLVIAAYAPQWAWLPVGAVVVVVLARHGRPRGKPMIERAVVAARFEKLTPDVVIRALGALGIAAINQAIAADPINGIEFPDPIHKDGPGWLANINLPHGVTATEVMDRREKLASGLRRELGCVWPEATPGKHPGHLSLWVGYEDMNKTRQPAWQLARHGTADLFKPVPFGADQRGRVVPVLLMFVSVIIGSVPRMGKTFMLRLLCLIAALDVRAELHLYDLKGTGDLSPLECVAHRYRAGDEPEDIDYALGDMRALRDELRRRTKVVRGLPREECPENKVTRSWRPGGRCACTRL
jgi:DNA segregation ATPase FtsK/SpoIIIE, S-DNA-T family